MKSNTSIMKSNFCSTIGDQSRGEDLGGTGGDGPPKNLRWGDGPCIGPPIFREVVLSDARESIRT